MGVIAVVLLLLAAACAADVDPELTLLPADTTIVATIPPLEDTDPDSDPIVATTVTTPPTTSTTTTTVVENRTGNPRRATTDNGDVLGERADGIVAFQAIPYAASPVGRLRFDLPEAPGAFESDFDATTPGLACPQNPNDRSVQLFLPPAFAEECLTLDVFTPATGDELPVMVWFHGGDFATGSAHSEAFDGSNLATRDVVVVNVNYRLDALGFLITDEMVRTANGDAFGNRGFQDQIAALEWVQRNIRDFGGNPANVTIFGQGSGAKSVCGHLASPKSSGLFHKAILQSGGACDSLLTVEQAIARGQRWLDETSCARAQFVLGCLQFLDLDEMLLASASSGVTFGLVADGVYLDRSALSLASTDELGDVPLLIGSTLDEGSLFTSGADSITDQELRDLVLIELEGNTDLLLSQYESLETNLEKLATFLTDSQYACAADRFASAAGDEAVVYTYQLIHRSSDTPLALGATHGSDVILLFGNPEAVAGYASEELNAEDVLVADFIQAAWTTFAADGAPGGAAADWPPYLDSSPAHLLIGLENTISASVQDGRCEILIAAQ